MSYVQHRPPTAQIMNVIRSVLKKTFKDKISQPNKILDLFCGNGILSFGLVDMLNIDYIVGIDRDFRLIKKFEKKIYQHGLKGKAICLDAFKIRFNMIFDIVLIDPPFKFNMCEAILANLTKRKMIAKDGIIISRSSKKHKLDQLDQIGSIMNEIEIGQNKIIFICGF